MSLGALIGLSVGALIALLALALTVFGTWLFIRKQCSGPPHLDAPFALYPVSILKPLKGRDSELKENLESFFKVEYPDFEILFSVADSGDPAIALVNELMGAYPRVRARLFVGARNIGPNPKVNNLARSYEAAANDLILISDSNVRVAPDYLKRQVAHLDPSVGVVTATVAGVTNSAGQSCVGANLEASFLNTFYARWMGISEYFNQPCVIGKSMMFRRSGCERFGGIKILGLYLAEDYMAGQAFKRLGLRVVIASDPIEQVIGKYSTRQFWSRHIRWGRIRKSQAPLAFLFELLFSSIGSGILGALACRALFGFSPAAVLAVHLLIWSSCDFLMMLRMEKRIGLLSPYYWFLRELLHFPLWVHILIGNSVNWQGHRLTVRAGGLVN